MRQWTIVAKTLHSPVGEILTGILLALVLAAPTVSGVTLEWDPSPDAWVAGYAVHYGTVSSNYTVRIDVGNQTSATISNLTAGVTYYFVATAYTADGQESLPSNEVAYTVPFSQTNQAPQIVAGADQTITLPATATLSASVTDDGLPTELGMVSVVWSSVSGPGMVTFSDPTTVATTAAFSQPGSYVLRLMATDGDLISTDELTVTVNLPVMTELTFASTAGTISAPFVVSGDTISQPALTTVSSGGRAAYNFTIVNAGDYTVSALVNAPNTAADSFFVNIDAEPTDPTMIWDVPLTSGLEERVVSWRGNGTFDSAQFAPKVFNLSAGTHHLIVRGREGNCQLGAITIAPYVMTPPADTTPPMVALGAPDGGATVSSSVTVSATASDNVDVVGVQFKLDGANLGAEDTTSPYSVIWNTTSSANGSYTLTAVARDVAGNQTTASPVTVQVNNVANTAPVVQAGPDQTITLPATVALSASVSDDGYPTTPGQVTVTWTQISGSGSVTFGNAANVQTSASFSTAGTYVLRLTAGDGVLSSFDDLAVTVEAAAELPHNVGQVTLEWDPSPDEWVAGYAVHYGTVSSNYTVRIDVGNQTSATISNLTAGVTYYFVATAYTADGQESLPSNEVAYTVPFSQTNQAPQIVAGADQTITLPATATLSASVTDDGLPTELGMVSVVWSSVSGPGMVTFSNPTTAATTAAFSQPGSYVLQVTAWDGLLASSDELTVTVAAQPLTIAGTIKTYTGQVVPGVTVTLSGDSSQTTTTASDGTYAFNVIAGGSYAVAPTKTDDIWATAGVSTADIGSICRHIMGIAYMDSPYKIVAADVNETKSVSTADIGNIQRFILGLSTNIGPQLWRFFASGFSFSNPANPWTTPLVTGLAYSNLATSATGQDYVAVKMGDVNGTWTPPSGSNLQLKGAPLAVHVTGPTVTFAALPQTVTAGETVSVPIIVSGFQEVTSAQFSLAWDRSVLQFLSTGDFKLPGLGAGNFNTTTEGKLAFAWNDFSGVGKDREDGTAIFTIQFKVVGANGMASTLSFMDSPTAREVSVDGCVATLAGDAGQITITESTPLCSSIQGGPNGSLRIGFKGVPGRTYTVEYCESLNSPTWLPLDQATADEQGLFDYVDTPPVGSGSRFYRLVYGAQ